MTHDCPAPYDNCAFTYCDLPGQCRREGKCHHPKKVAHAEVVSSESVNNETQPVAKVMDLGIGLFNRLVYEEGVDKDAPLYLAKPDARPVIVYGVDDSDRARIEWCIETVRAIADLGRERLGDLYPQSVMVVSTLKRVLEPSCEAQMLGVSPQSPESAT